MPSMLFLLERSIHFLEESRFFIAAALQALIFFRAGPGQFLQRVRSEAVSPFRYSYAYLFTSGLRETSSYVSL